MSNAPGMNYPSIILHGEKPTHEQIDALCEYYNLDGVHPHWKPAQPVSFFNVLYLTRCQIKGSGRTYFGDVKCIPVAEALQKMAEDAK